MEYEIRAKRKDNEKWWGFGRIKKNQYGNYQIGMKKTKELMGYINAIDDGGYINFSLFEPKGDAAEPLQKPKPSVPELDDELPF